MAEEKTVQKENPMGTRPINSLLISMSLPIMISMIVQALYNIVDSMFVARVSENALTAVSLAFRGDRYRRRYQCPVVPQSG